MFREGGPVAKLIEDCGLRSVTWTCGCSWSFLRQRQSSEDDRDWYATVPDPRLPEAPQIKGKTL